MSVSNHLNSFRSNLWGFFFRSQDILRIQNLLSLLPLHSLEVDPHFSKNDWTIMELGSRSCTATGFIILYYWASAIKSFAFRLDASIAPPNWLTGKLSFLFCRSFTPSSHSNHHINLPLYLIIHNHTRVWIQIKSHVGLKSTSLAIPITKNPRFIPSNLDRTFFTWSDSGSHCVQGIYIEDPFTTLAERQFHLLSLKRPSINSVSIF